MKQKEIRLIFLVITWKSDKAMELWKNEDKSRVLKLVENKKIERQRWHSFLHVEQISGNWFNEVIGSSCYNIHTVMSKHCAL